MGSDGVGWGGVAPPTLAFWHQTAGVNVRKETPLLLSGIMTGTSLQSTSCLRFAFVALAAFSNPVIISCLCRPGLLRVYCHAAWTFLILSFPSISSVVCVFLQESTARFNRNVNRVLKAVDWPDAKKVKRPHSHRQHHEHHHEDMPPSSSSHQAGPSSSPLPEAGVSLAARIIMCLYTSSELLPRKSYKLC